MRQKSKGRLLYYTVCLACFLFCFVIEVFKIGIGDLAAVAARQVLAGNAYKGARVPLVAYIDLCFVSKIGAVKLTAYIFKLFSVERI